MWYNDLTIISLKGLKPGVEYNLTHGDVGPIPVRYVRSHTGPYATSPTWVYFESLTEGGKEISLPGYTHNVHWSLRYVV